MRWFLSCLLLAACGDSGSEGLGGFVIQVQFDENLDLDTVARLELVISKTGGFPQFNDRMAGEITVSSSDANGDKQNEVVLTWPQDRMFTATERVRLVFDNQAAMPIVIEGTAANGSGVPVATGSLPATVPPGGEGEADVTLACIVAGCRPTTDGGRDLGAADAGSDAPDMPPDAGEDMFPDTTLRQAGETVTVAGRSAGVTDGGTMVEVDHQMGNAVLHGKSTSGSLEAESTLTITR